MFEAKKEAHTPELTKNMKIFSHKLFLCAFLIIIYSMGVLGVESVENTIFHVQTKCVCMSRQKNMKFPSESLCVHVYVRSMLELGLSGGGGRHTTIKRGNRSTFSHSTQTIFWSTSHRHRLHYTPNIIACLLEYDTLIKYNT